MMMVRDEEWEERGDGCGGESDYCCEMAAAAAATAAGLVAAPAAERHWERRVVSCGRRTGCRWGDRGWGSSNGLPPPSSSTSRCRVGWLSSSLPLPFGRGACCVLNERKERREQRRGGGGGGGAAEGVEGSTAPRRRRSCRRVVFALLAAVVAAVVVGAPHCLATEQPNSESGDRHRGGPTDSGLEANEQNNEKSGEDLYGMEKFPWRLRCHMVLIVTGLVFAVGVIPLRVLSVKEQVPAFFEIACGTLCGIGIASGAVAFRYRSKYRKFVRNALGENNREQQQQEEVELLQIPNATDGGASRNDSNERPESPVPTTEELEKRREYYEGELGELDGLFNSCFPMISIATIMAGVAALTPGLAQAFHPFIPIPQWSSVLRVFGAALLFGGANVLDNRESIMTKYRTNLKALKVELNSRKAQAYRRRMEGRLRKAKNESERLGSALTEKVRKARSLRTENTEMTSRMKELEQMVKEKDEKIEMLEQTIMSITTSLPTHTRPQTPQGRHWGTTTASPSSQPTSAAWQSGTPAVASGENQRNSNEEEEKGTFGRAVQCSDGAGVAVTLMSQDFDIEKSSDTTTDGISTGEDNTFADERKDESMASGIKEGVSYAFSSSIFRLLPPFFGSVTAFAMLSMLIVAWRAKQRGDATAAAAAVALQKM